MKFFAIHRGGRALAYYLAPSSARALALWDRDWNPRAGAEATEIPRDQADQQLLDLANQRSWREGSLAVTEDNR